MLPFIVAEALYVPVTVKVYELVPVTFVPLTTIETVLPEASTILAPLARFKFVTVELPVRIHSEVPSILTVSGHHSYQYLPNWSQWMQHRYKRKYL